MPRLPDRLHGQVEHIAGRHLDAMVTVIDDAEIIRYASSNSFALFGYLPDEVVGQKISEFFGSMDVAILRLALADAVLNGESVKITRQVQLKLGGTKCMRGPVYGFIDRHSRQVFALAIGRPCATS